MKCEIQRKMIEKKLRFFTCYHSTSSKFKNLRYFTLIPVMNPKSPTRSEPEHTGLTDKSRLPLISATRAPTRSDGRPELPPSRRRLDPPPRASSTALTGAPPTPAAEEKPRRSRCRRWRTISTISTASKATDLAQPLVEAEIPLRIHIVKERLCLEVERLGLSAMIMGSRVFGAPKTVSKGRLGSVSDYCVHHCICPVVVVRYPEEKDGGRDEGKGVVRVGEEVELHTVPEEEQEQEEYHDASNEHKDA